MQNVSGRMCFRYCSVTLLSVNYQFIDCCLVFLNRFSKRCYRCLEGQENTAVCEIRTEFKLL